MKLSNYLLAMISLASVLAVIETSLHIMNYPRTPEIGWRWDQSPYASADNKNDGYINQFGLRGRNIEYGEDDFVIVLLGDSQVEAGLHSAEKLPEILLEAELCQLLHSRHIKVFSVASAGWGQDQQLTWLRHYFDSYRADLVLAWTTPVNDYWENTFVDRSVERVAGKLKPTFRIDDDKLVPVVLFRFESKLLNLFRLAIARGSGNKTFTLEQIYSDRWQAALPSPDGKASSKGQCPVLEILEKDLIESFVAGSRSFTLVTDEDVENGRSHFSPFLKKMSERDNYSIAITHRLFEEIANLSRAKGAQFRIFHPYRSDLDGAFREIKCVKTLAKGQYFEFDGSDWLRYLRQSNLKNELLTVDIIDSHPMNVARSDWHLSYEGNTRAMGMLANSLVKTGLVELQVRKR